MDYKKILEAYMGVVFDAEKTTLIGMYFKHEDLTNDEAKELIRISNQIENEEFWEN